MPPLMVENVFFFSMSLEEESIQKIPVQLHLFLSLDVTLKRSHQPYFTFRPMVSRVQDSSQIVLCTGTSVCVCKVPFRDIYHKFRQKASSYHQYQEEVGSGLRRFRSFSNDCGVCRSDVAYSNAIDHRRQRRIKTVKSVLWIMSYSSAVSRIYRTSASYCSEMSFESVHPV